MLGGVTVVLIPLSSARRGQLCILLAMQVSLRYPGSERLAAPRNTSASDPHHLTP